MAGIILLVTERSLEMHARTQSKWIGIQHRFIVPHEVVRIVIGAIGSLCRMLGVLVEIMSPHGVRARRHRRGIVVAGDVGRGTHGGIMLLVNHVGLGIILLFYADINQGFNTTTDLEENSNAGMESAYPVGHSASGMAMGSTRRGRGELGDSYHPAWRPLGRSTPAGRCSSAARFG